MSTAAATVRPNRCWSPNPPSNGRRCARCAVGWSPRELRGGQGAHVHLAIYGGIDLGGWARAYRGKVVAMVAAEGTSLYEADLTGPVAIAIGNEGTGLSDDLVAAARL